MDYVGSSLNLVARLRAALELALSSRCLQWHPQGKNRLLLENDSFKKCGRRSLLILGPLNFHNQKLAQIEFDKAHPWGGDISARPGLLGKIGHIAAKVGTLPATFSLLA